jgi:hypothetical protein
MLAFRHWELQMLKYDVVVVRSTKSGIFFGLIRARLDDSLAPNVE